MPMKNLMITAYDIYELLHDM